MAKILIVGAGAYGCTVARVLTDAGHKCLVLDRRDHIGGNCYTRYDGEAGCHEHVYGAHIFHTQHPQVWEFVNRFAEFNRYTHRVRAVTARGVVPMPINLDTMQRVLGVTSPEAARAKLKETTTPLERIPESAEEYCLATIGPDLYRLLIRDYTMKQWRRHPSQLPASIVARLPLRFTYDDAYFSDPYQGVPVEGYTTMFGRMTQGVQMEYGVDYLRDAPCWLKSFDHVFYSGAIDEFFGYTLGALEYRSLRFKSMYYRVPDKLGVAVMNYPEAAVPWTRRIEHKHFHQVKGRQSTLITEEYPDDWMPGKEAFYPVVTQANLDRYDAYKELASEREDAARITFGGRLGRFRYYDMDQVIGSAIADAKHYIQ